jgi:hypothetical protein
VRLALHDKKMTIDSSIGKCIMVIGIFRRRIIICMLRRVVTRRRAAQHVVSAVPSVSIGSARVSNTSISHCRHYSMHTTKPYLCGLLGTKYNKTRQSIIVMNWEVVKSPVRTRRAKYTTPPIQTVMQRGTCYPMQKHNSGASSFESPSAGSSDI